LRLFLTGIWLKKKYDIIDFEVSVKTLTGAGFPILQRKKGAISATCR